MRGDAAAAWLDPDCQLSPAANATACLARGHNLFLPQ
jgi:hypothetical protein